MDKKIESALNKAYDCMIPKDIYSRIEQNVFGTYERTMILPMKKNYNKKVIRYVLSAAAALVLVFTGAFGGIYYSNNIAIDSVIGIDVNPSVQITANKHDRVLDAIAVNKEAQIVLADMNLKDTDLNVAVNAIIGSMFKNGYLEDKKTDKILVTVQNDNTEKAQNVKTSILTNIKEQLKANHVSATVYNQTTGKENAEAQKVANDYGISIGKGIFINNLCKKYPELNANELANKSIAEISDYVAENKLDISDIIDYDYDDSIHENIADEIEDINEDIEEKEEAKEEKPKKEPIKENNESKVQSAVTSKVESTVSKAEPIVSKPPAAENKIESTESKVEPAESKVEPAESKVESTESKVEPAESKVESVQVDTNNNSEPATPKKISLDEAKQVALNNAELSEKDVKFIKAELDSDDGALIYEIDFKANGYEYDYEIKALNGKIIKKDIEKDDDKVISNPEKEGVSKEEAQKAAVKHAGFNYNNVTFISAKLTKDDGVKLYEIEFRVGGYEYDYDVAYKDGKVLKHSKEADKQLVTNSGTELTKNEVKEIVFNHANVSAADVRNLEIERDKDDGEVYYEVEFKAGGYEYSCTVDAFSGKVTEFEKERDD